MAKFTVRRVVDAYVIEDAEVEADNAQAAVERAREHESELDWHERDVATFDARDFVALDEEGDLIEATRVGDL